jgi:hypothetical protein
VNPIGFLPQTELNVHGSCCSSGLGIGGKHNGSLSVGNSILTLLPITVKLPVNPLELKSGVGLSNVNISVVVLPLILTILYVKLFEYPVIIVPFNVPKTNVMYSASLKLLSVGFVKVEVDERLPQNRADDTEITVQTPVEKRKYNRRELPPPREGREGVRREAFSRAMKHFQQNLKKRNK